jgi:hypothetical protein
VQANKPSHHRKLNQEAFYSVWVFFAKRRLFQVDVLLDPNSFAVGYQLITEGVALGIFYGDIKEGVSVEVKTDNVNGKSELYLKNGNEVWHRVDLVSTSPKETVEGSYKVFSF